MKEFYIEVLNDKNKYNWIKISLSIDYDELTLNSIILSLNQFLINTNPSEVFFNYPNALFKKVNNTEYKTYNKKSKISTITVENKDAIYTQTYSSYSAMKNALYDLLTKRKGKEWIE